MCFGSMEGVSEPAVFRLPGGLPVLTDRRIAAGITFKHHANQTRDKFLIEIMGGSVAAFDEDNEAGRPDPGLPSRAPSFD